MFTLADYNYSDVTNMFDYARRIGIRAVILERFVPEGQSRSLIKHALTREQWFKVIRDIINYYDLGLTPRDFLAYRAFWIDFADEVEVLGALCDHGENSMALMPNGDIYPCRRTPVKMGNIIHDDMRSIIERLGDLRKGYRSKLQGMCRDCKIDECIGCRALARALANDIYAEDPQCYYNLLQ
jgi:radical SAM protein with 4Fe4S-binding SPASM domain